MFLETTRRNDTRREGLICDSHHVTVSLNDTQHNNALPLCWVSHFIYHYAECRYAVLYPSTKLTILHEIWRDKSLTKITTWKI